MSDVVFTRRVRCPITDKLTPSVTSDPQVPGDMKIVKRLKGG